MMGARGAAVLGALGWIAAAAACGGASSYACSTDAQCIGGDGAAGYCEASGYCSFDDGTCASGRRYGSLAPSDLAGECTAPADEPTGSVDLTTSISTTASEASSSDDDSTAGSSGTPVDPVTSSASSVSSVSSASAEATGSTTEFPEPETDATAEGSTSGTVVPDCTPVLTEDFEDGNIDPLWEDGWASAGCSYAEGDGALSFTVAASMDWVSAGLHTEPSAIAGGYVRVQVLPFSAPQDVIGVWLSLFDPSDCELQIALENYTVRGRIDQTWFDMSMVDGDEPIWLQLRTEEDGMVHWEWSTDGVEWNLEHSEESPCDLMTTRSGIFAGGPHGQADPITRSVGFYERCDPS